MSWSIDTGDCRTLLSSMPAESVQTCITSPPYFGLRDYGMAGQIGAEETPEAFVAELVAVFRDVRRVLRADGTLWLNLGDSYAGSWGNQGRKETRGTQRPINRPMVQNVGSVQHAIDCDMDDDCTCTPVVSGVYPSRTHTGSWVNNHPTLKPKDLIGIPWRVALALQADGWWLRQDIIWSKPNPMPESIRDRCTKSHEYLFLLSKSDRYFYDHEAIREDAVSTHGSGNGFAGRQGGAGHMPMSGGAGTAECWEPGGARNKRSVWTVPVRPFSGAHFATFPPALIEPCVLAGSRIGDVVLDPFTGAGTTGLVALKHQRSFRGVELNPSYADMARARIRDDMPLLNRVGT